MKSDNAIFGWLSFNIVLEAIKKFLGWIDPLLSPLLTISQIAVAIATVILIIYKIRAARKAKAKDVLDE